MRRQRTVLLVVIAGLLGVLLAVWSIQPVAPADGDEDSLGCNRPRAVRYGEASTEVGPGKPEPKEEGDGTAVVTAGNPLVRPDTEAPTDTGTPAEEQPAPPLLVLPSLGAPIPLVASKVPLPGTGHVENPVFSPSGQHLAFELNNTAGNIDLFLTGVAGTTTENLHAVALPGASAFGTEAATVAVDPVWHPEGVVVFTASMIGGVSRLYFAVPDGTLATELVPASTAPGELEQAAISPDGSLLSYTAIAGAPADLYVWDRASGIHTRLTATAVAESHPAFSRSGQTLYFSRSGRTDEDIYSVALSDQEEQLVAGGLGTQIRPIAAAGGRVLWFSIDDDVVTLQLLTDPTAEPVPIAVGARLPVRAPPALSPDGEWVGWTAADPPQSRFLYLMAIDGSEVLIVETEQIACGEPSLAFRGDRVLLAYTALPDADSEWRQLYLSDITDLF